MEIVVALLIVGAATAIILNLGRFAERSHFHFSDLQYINTQAKYQALLFVVAIVVLLVLYVVNRANFLIFLGPGNITAPAKGVSWMGISEGESWLSLGSSLSFFITLATSTFVYFQFRKSGGGLKRLLPYLPWVLLFSLTNSFAEEIVYRIGVIVPLAGSIDTVYILLISAVAFGVPHLRGMPNGIIGALMAGLLGWLLAKSVIETNGIFWAWFIHTLQDIVIFSAFVMAAANKSLKRTSDSLGRFSSN
jgi:membrane protease YdiL (CAAX protease family)